VEVLSSPTSVAWPPYLMDRCTPEVTLGRLVEETEPRFSIFGWRLLAYRNNANRHKLGHTRRGFK
jgi:hypothetical protein